MAVARAIAMADVDLRARLRRTADDMAYNTQLLADRSERLRAREAELRALTERLGDERREAEGPQIDDHNLKGQFDGRAGRRPPLNLTYPPPSCLTLM